MRRDGTYSFRQSRRPLFLISRSVSVVADLPSLSSLVLLRFGFRLTHRGTTRMTCCEGTAFV